MNHQAPEQEIPQRARRRRGRRILLVAVLLGACSVAALAFLQSALFQEMLRRRLVGALERATGGRVELKAFSLSLSRLEVSLHGLVLHGLESAQQPPLFSADLLQAGWNLRSVWGLEADLSRVRLWQPKVYIQVSEQGRTNLPLSRARMRAAGGWVERLLALQVRQFEVLRGQFSW